MGDPFGIEMAKVRQEELLREAEQRRIGRAVRGLHRGRGWRLDVGRLLGADSGRGPIHGTLKS